MWSMGKQECREWTRYARDDMEAAGILLEHHPGKNEIICYHCQQSAEKYLKSLLALLDKPIPRSHSSDRRLVERSGCLNQLTLRLPSCASGIDGAAVRPAWALSTW
jgi:HEPN domain-containing protein